MKTEWYTEKGSIFMDSKTTLTWEQHTAVGEAITKELKKLGVELGKPIPGHGLPGEQK